MMEPPPAPLHLRYGGQGAQENALAVDVHNPVPLLAAGVFQLAPVADAGVVDQDIQLAVAVHCGLHCRFPLRLAGDVQVHVGGLAAQFANLGLHLLAQVVENVAEDHAGALGGEHAGLAGALAPGAAAD